MPTRAFLIHRSLRPSLAAGALVLVLMVSLAEAQTRGYQSRPCGFDLNFNGVVGEPADCNVCDGVTTDVDGNGVADDLRYVDCGGGTDSGACTPAAPCRTVPFAQNALGAPGGNQIQAICVRGTCNSAQWRPSLSGAAGTYLRPATGTQGRAFQYPRYPVMLVGWDTDNDGAYPPHDSTQPQPAVFDGNGAGATLSFFENDNSQDRIEVAHLTIRDYNANGVSVEGGGTTIDPNPSGDADHLAFHDLVIATSSAGGEGGWTRAYGGNNANWHVYDNIQVPAFQGFVGWRGECVDGTNCGPVRFQKVSITQTVGSTGSPGGKAWGWWSDVEVLDSTFTCNNTGNYGWRVLQCNQGARLINNEWTNCLTAGIDIQPGDPDSCDSPARPVTNVVIDRNQINATTGNGFGGRCIMVEDSAGNGDEYLADLTITNNVCSARGNGASAWDSCFLIGGGTSGSGDLPGVYTIANNTCAMDVGNGFRRGALYITNDVIGSASRRQQDFVIRNNIFTGQGSGDSVWVETPSRSAISASANVCDPQADCAAFEGSPLRCDPSFVNAGGGDVHLQSGDTCARDRGVAVAGVTADVDGQARPQGAGWDIGADEVGSGGGGIAPPVLLDVTVENP
jgi:hypothetical protein